MSINLNDLIIFEMANNHQGNLEHGLKIIKKLGEVVRKYNINAAVKFQYRDLDSFIHPDFVTRNDVKHIPRFMSTKLSKDEFNKMVIETKTNGMLAMCTPFDEKSVDVCVEQNIDILKVASCSSNDWPLLEKIYEVNLPTIISTGGKTFSDMDKVYNFFSHRNMEFAMLHCVGLYPVGYEFVQLDCITKMKDRYPGINIGYSGHENPLDFLISQMAIAKGAVILERHIGLGTDTITLNDYSTDVNSVEAWIISILNAKKICNIKEQKYISNEELTSMRELSRGCFVNKYIKKGDIISKKDIFFAMPCLEGQLTSSQFEDGIIATKNYDLNEAIYEKVDISTAKVTRSIIHEIKSMLNEAKIIVGSDFQLDLSHHFGLGKFRDYGASFINIINREYCKKIAILLPNQQHPLHYHKLKEESFQVLSGELKLMLNGEEKMLLPGDIVTVHRNDMHSFSSEKGCIFEEISTTYVKNDSFYNDENINKLDPMERKTILENW